jgi:hypothetical protein
MAITINGSGITSANIADDAITAGKLAPNAVTKGKMADDSVGTYELEANAVSSGKIADATIVNLKSGRKNLIINGGFDVWQRGTSSNTTGYVSADRWYQSYANTVTKETDGNDNVMKVIGQGHSASRFGQKIEGGKLRGKTVTLSFTVKSPDSTSMTLRWGHSPETQTSTYEQAITSAWQRYSHTINLGDGTGATDVFTFFEFYVRYSDTYYFKDVQLELGSVATDFEHRSYGEELALCQRYYEVVCKLGSSDVLGTANDWSGSQSYVPFGYKVEKRVMPTMVNGGTWYIFDAGGAHAGGSTVGAVGTKRGELVITGLSRNGFVRAYSSGYLYLDAEL